MQLQERSDRCVEKSARGVGVGGKEARHSIGGEAFAVGTARAEKAVRRQEHGVAGMDGDKIVVAGVHKLVAGEIVKPVPEPAAPGLAAAGAPAVAPVADSSARAQAAAPAAPAIASASK